MAPDAAAIKAHFQALEPPTLDGSGLPPPSYAAPPTPHEAALLAHHIAMFAGAVYVAPTLSENGRSGGAQWLGAGGPGGAGASWLASVGRPLRGATRAHLTSRNWAGASVPATSGRRFTRIVGTWAVPKITGPAPDTQTRLVSVWAGLGGMAPWSSSMPQIGSEHGWINGVKVNRLWCQWWLGNQSGGWLSHLLTEVPVLDPGDWVRVSLSVRPTANGAQEEVLFHWRWKNTVAGVRAICPRPVIASSANWMLERPTEVKSTANGPAKGELRPLPTFNEVELRDCLARLGPAGAPRLRRAFDAQLVTMRGFATGPSRLRRLLEPRMLAKPADASTVTVVQPA